MKPQIYSFLPYRASIVVACLLFRTGFSFSGRWYRTSRTGSTNSSNSNTKNSRRFTSAYSGEPGTGMLGLEKIDYIPYETKLKKTGERVVVAPFRGEEDWKYGMELMNSIIREGKTWPFDEEFESIDGYRGYFLSHTAFVVRRSSCDDSDSDSEDGEILGCFYIKPNFPGRCSHICNGGFITVPKFRQKGVATIMGRSFLKIARDLGYKSSYFNLVFKSNEASVRLWESLGFERVAVLEKAADLSGVDGLDTAYGYRFDLETLPLDYEI